MSDENDKPQSLTRDEMVRLTLAPLYEDMERHGIDADYLIKKLKKELNAKETKTVKIKGAVIDANLPRGRRLAVTSGTLAYRETKEGIEEVFGDGDSVIEWDEVAWGVRQKARQDAHKLLSHYPNEKIEHLGKNGQPLSLVEKIVVEVVQAPAREEDE